MAIRIIKAGEVIENRKYEVVCQICRSVLGFDYKDATYKFDQRDGDYLVITCPVCRYKVCTGVNSHIQSGE